MTDGTRPAPSVAGHSDRPALTGAATCPGGDAVAASRNDMHPTAMKKWWAGFAGEHYWMEITKRNDLGADLNAPLADEKGKQNANYALVREAEDGDIVFHLDKHREAIVAHSVVRGPAWEDQANGVPAVPVLAATTSHPTPAPASGARSKTTLPWSSPFRSRQ